MYNFESDYSLIIYVSRRNRQTGGVFYFGCIPGRPSVRRRHPPFSVARSRSKPLASSPHMCIHLMLNSHII